MTKKSFASVLVIIALGFASCAKPDIKGCMDKDSTNYDATATVDDGNCLYKGSVVFWWGQALSQSAVDLGATTVKMTMDGTFVGSLPVSSQYFQAAPTCGTAGALTAPYDLGTKNAKSVIIIAELMDEQNNLLNTVSTAITLTGNACISFEIK